MTVEIKRYSPIAGAIQSLLDNFGGVIYKVDIPSGMKSARAARATIREFRIELERCRVSEKKESLEYGREVDRQAKLIRDQILVIEEPIDDQIRGQEAIVAEAKQAKQRAEQERIDGIKARVQTIKNVIGDNFGARSDKLDRTLKALQTTTIDESFGEFATEALEARDDAITKLSRAFEVSKKNDILRDELKAEREAAAEAQREINEANAKKQAELNAQQAVIDAARAKQLEIEREAARKAKEAEIERLAKVAREDAVKLHMERLAKRKVSGPKKALAMIYAIVQEPMDNDSWDEIALICEANV
jgi:colicin import membrane protein